MIRGIEKMNNNLINEIGRLQSDFNQKLDNMNRSMQRLMIQPVSRLAIKNEESTNDKMRQRRAVLMKRPKDLNVLWHEYKFGQSDRAKPAEFFTPAERGKSKLAYSRREVFWYLVVNMFIRRYTSDLIIDKIYSTFGQALTVSTILVKLRNDNRRGGYPDLRAWLQQT